MTFVYGLKDDPECHFLIKFEYSNGFYFGFSNHLASAGYSAEDAFRDIADTMIQALNEKFDDGAVFVRVR